jgi:hypothetical protein
MCRDGINLNFMFHESRTGQRIIEPMRFQLTGEVTNNSIGTSFISPKPNVMGMESNPSSSMSPRWTGNYKPNAGTCGTVNTGVQGNCGHQPTTDQPVVKQRRLMSELTGRES